jgi:L-histidine Nalpha-methyltransferase
VQSRVNGSLLEDVRSGLTAPRKELDPKYFYDERGSALFEEITLLPEYYLTRAERSLLESVASSLISKLQPVALVELGAGSAIKTRILLDAMQSDGQVRQYVPVDVSEQFLRETAAMLRTEYRSFCIDPAVADFSFELNLPHVARPALFAFLGSTVGNFREDEAVAILKRVADQMSSDDHFLLGADLRKDVARIEAAYNDSKGVTAEFNLNVLRVINRELGADFDLSRFEHRAFYNKERHRIEMHLVSTGEQSVNIPDVGVVDFTDGESIRTELSHKYDRTAIESMFGVAGLELTEWLTGSDESFALAVGRLSAGV